MGYQEQVLGMEVILGVFFLCTAALLLVSWYATRGLKTAERVIGTWMVVSGAIHLIIEGAFSLYDKFYTNTDPTWLLLELWKEYSKADSRYATRDSFVVAMETVTAFAWGPGCFLVFAGLLSRASWRWALLTMVSLGQLYGDVLYFATCWLEGSIHTRPEPMYFWFYYIFMNIIWIITPTWCLWYATCRTMEAVSLAEKASEGKTL